VRFEVALVDHKETFAWPGAQKFEATDLATMLPRGLIDTGDFATELRELFDGKSATFSNLSEEKIGAAVLTRFDFAVPAVHSGLQVNQSQQGSAYRGELFIDPASLDPRRIQVVVEVQPKDGVSAASKQLTRPVSPSARVTSCCRNRPTSAGPASTASNFSTILNSHPAASSPAIPF